MSAYRRSLALALAGGFGLSCATSSGTPPACAGQADAGTTCVARVDGVVTDPGGKPLPRVSVSMCSTACYGAATGADGAYSIAIGRNVSLSDFVFHASGRPDFADVYAKVDAAPRDGVLTIAPPVKLAALPFSGPALLDGAAASRPASGDVTLDVPAGTTFELDVADVALGEKGRELRVANVPLGDSPDFVRAVSGVAALYVLAPPGARASAPLGVHMANRAGLPERAPVELWILDDAYTSLPPTAGTARFAALAHVSADGTTIDSDPGEGITKLTWLLVKPR